MAEKRQPTYQEILATYTESEQPFMQKIVDQLMTWRFLVPLSELTNDFPEESPLDIFYWQYNTNIPQIKKRMQKVQFTLMGDNAINRQLIKSLQTLGCEQITLVDFPLLQEETLGLGASDFPLTDYEEWQNTVDLNQINYLVASSAVGNFKAIRDWNAF